ncbi:hypothetical protein BM28_A1185 [Brucella melitensis M28]|nr:hypothetical protein BM28_A1185 [Brucella melitensis M28]AIJ84981.1 hypothetical protein DK62_246 [Brucella melitensis bv. 3 str. Ether]AIJ89559.1 hypothetical protein DK63_612 [Brucella melitensis bv. 1 str. 16M]
MQDAEKYEAVGRHIPCHGTDCCCRRYDLQEPLGHRAPAYAATMGKYEAEADQKQEAGGYAARKELPSALCCRRRCHIAKKFQIPAEMIDRHRYQGDAVRNVDPPKTWARRRRGFHFGYVLHGLKSVQKKS